MISCRNSLSQKLTAQNPITFTVHSYAHCLALACTDTVKELQNIQDCECGLAQTWRFFSISHLKAEKLKEMQAAADESHGRPRRKLVKACRTRWLSHYEAVIALKTEFSSVYATLHFFVTKNKDCTPFGIF